MCSESLRQIRIWYVHTEYSWIYVFSVFLSLWYKKYCVYVECTKTCHRLKMTCRLLYKAWYSLVYDFSVFRSPGTKKTYVDMYRGSTITTTRHFIFLRLTMAKLADFDTTISNSFLGQISSLRHRNPSQASALGTH